ARVVWGVRDPGEPDAAAGVSAERGMVAAAAAQFALLQIEPRLRALSAQHNERAATVGGGDWRPVGKRDAGEVAGGVAADRCRAAEAAVTRERGEQLPVEVACRERADAVEEQAESAARSGHEDWRVADQLPMLHRFGDGACADGVTGHAR